MIKLLLCTFCMIPVHASSYTAWKADAAYKAEDFSLARTLYEDAVAGNPQDWQSLYNVGKSAYKQKEYAAATIAFKAVSLADSSVRLKEQAFFNLGDSELLQKKYEEALAAYEQVLKITPDNKHAKDRIELVKKLMEEQKQQEKKDQDSKDQKNDDTNQKQDQDQKKNQDQQDNKDQSDSQGKDQGGNQQEQDTKKDQSGNQDPRKDGEEKDDQKKDQKDGSDSSSEKDNKPSDQSKADNKETDSSERDSKSEGQPDKQDTSSKNDKEQGDDRERDNKPSEKSKQDGEQDEQRGQQDPQQDHGSQGQNKSHVDDTDKAEQESEHGSKLEKDHALPQSKEIQSGSSVPENNLSEKDRKGLAALDDEDKELFKAYFGRVNGGKPRLGQKNW